MKPLFANKNPMSEKITLIEDGRILSNDMEVFFFSIHIKYYNYKATFYYTTRLTMQHYRDDAKRSTGQ